MFPYPVSRSRMGDICSHDHNRNFKEIWPGLGCQHMVDTSKLGVELEAEVGKNLEEDAYKYIDTIVRRDCAYTCMFTGPSGLKRFLLMQHWVGT
jgi:hypothetical protein